MLGISWYWWVLLAIVALAGQFFVILHIYHRSIQRGFLAFLREHHPEFQVVGTGGAYLKLRTSDGTDIQFRWSRLYLGVGDAKAYDAASRQPVFEHALQCIVEGQDLTETELNLEKHGNRIMPRLVRPEHLAELQKRAVYPHTPVDSLGLEIVYLIDSPHSVAFLSADQMEELGLDRESLHEHAMANLSKPVPIREPVDNALQDDSIICLKTMDGFDATRLLLVPGCLEEGEELATAIPDRDTLILASRPTDGNWSNLAKLASIADSDHLLLRCPIRVTTSGFELR